MANLRHVGGIGAKIVLLALMICGSNAYADQFHYNNLIIGDRASGMGGAYTAISDDATGLYYNPAGIVYSSGRNLSASVNAYYNLTKKYDGVIGGQGWVRNSSALLPNYFGIVQPLGKVKFGFSYAVPDSINEDQDQTFYNLSLSSGLAKLNPYVYIPSYYINFNNEDNTYNFGPSIAMEISKKLSVGVTLYAHQRKAQRILNQFITFRGTSGSSNTDYKGFEWDNTYLQISETGIRPILGIMYAPVDKLSIGFAVSKTYILSSTRTIQNTMGTDNLYVDAITNKIPPEPIIDTTTVKRIYPTQMSFGAAYFVSDNLLVTGDLSYFTETESNDPSFGSRSAVLNIALGTEYFLTKNWAVRGGYFTNYANTPEITPGIRSQTEEHIDMLGGTMSLSHYTRNTSITLGGSVTQGKGKAQITGSGATQDASTFGWTLSLSSTYSY